MDSQRRVVSGMRPSGRLHLGHYNGVLKNWVRLQHEYECFFCIVDWHALTTDYEHPQQVAEHTGLHPNTVRFHLERLENEGLVSRHVRRSGDPGRPRLAYVATPVPDVAAGRRHFEQ